MSLEYEGQSIHSMKWNGLEILGGGGTIVGGDGLPVDWEDGLVVDYKFTTGNGNFQHKISGSYSNSSVSTDWYGRSGGWYEENEFVICLSEEESEEFLTLLNTANNTSLTLDTCIQGYYVPGNRTGYTSISSVQNEPVNVFMRYLINSKGTVQVPEYTKNSSPECIRIDYINKKYFLSYPYYNSKSSRRYNTWHTGYGYSYSSLYGYTHFILRGTPKYWCAPRDALGLSSGPFGTTSGDNYYVNKPADSRGYVTKDGVFVDDAVLDSDTKKNVVALNIIGEKICWSRCASTSGMFGTNSFPLNRSGLAQNKYESIVFPESWDFSGLKSAVYMLDGYHDTSSSAKNLTDITMTSDQWDQLEAAGATIGSWQTLHLT